MNELVKQLLKNRFDTPDFDKDQIYQAHLSIFETDTFWEIIKEYFNRRLDEVTNQLNAKEPVFLTYLFHIITGYWITHGIPNQEYIDVILNYVKSTRDGLGGYLPIHRDYIKQFPKLGNSPNNPMVPEVYASYYGFWIERLLGYSHSTHEVDGL